MSNFENPAAIAEANRLIDEAFENGSAELNLSGLRLRKLPLSIGKLSNTLKSLDLGGSREIVSLSGIECLIALESLDIAWCEKLECLHGLEHLENLKALTLVYCKSLTSLSGLDKLSGITSLQITGCRGLCSIKEIKGLERIESLSLSYNSNLNYLDDIKNLKSLTHLVLSDAPDLTDLSQLNNLEKLTYLELDDCKNLSCMSGAESLRGLTSLSIGLNNGFKDVSWIEGFEKISKLSLYNFSGLTDFSIFRSCKNLSELNLSNCKNLKSVSGIEHLEKLTKLFISESGELSDLTGLETLKYLSDLSISECKKIESISGISKLNNLKSLRVMDCDSICDFKIIENITDLNELYISSSEEDVIPPSFKNLVNLESLNLNLKSNTDFIDECHKMVSLRELCLFSVNDFKSICQIKELVNLTEIFIFSCEFFESLDGIDRLGNIESLIIRNCNNFESLSGIEALNKLKTLEISSKSLCDFSGMDKLNQLRNLYIGEAKHFINIKEIENLINLRHLILTGWDATNTVPWGIGEKIIKDFPYLRIFGDFPIEHVPAELTEDINLDAIEDWYSDLISQGVELADTVKVILLGNGRIGKTQLARRLVGESYDPTIPSTHGIQIRNFTYENGTLIQVWDFGGQDVYLGTHSLFLDKRAIYLVLWHPDYENTNTVVCEELNIKNKPLSYWLAYLNSIIGESANIIICQSQCDTTAQEMKEPVPYPYPFKRLNRSAFSSKSDDGLDLLLAQFSRSLKHQLNVNGEVWLPKNWMTVARIIREKISSGEKRLSFSDFKRLCLKSGVSAYFSFLQYIHQSGLVFYKEGNFNEDLILDQEWALQGVYLLLERNNALPLLKENDGKFTKDTISRILWDDGQSDNDKDLFIEMMEQCGVCFSIDDNRYVTPDALPSRQKMESGVSQIWQDADADIHVRLDYQFLHDATQRVILSRIGTVAKAFACYWRYGCCYFDSNHNVKVLFECVELSDSELEVCHIDTYSRPGHIDIKISGSNGNKLAEHLVDSIRNIHSLGSPPEVNWLKGSPSGKKLIEGDSEVEPFSNLGKGIEPTKHNVFFSYAWGEETDERQVICDEIYKKVAEIDWIVVHRDRESMDVGDSIDKFERRIARGEFVVLLISEKSLQSEHCMKELGLIYQHCQGQYSEFVNRIVPVILSDAKIGDPIARLKVAMFWKSRVTELKTLVDELGADIAGAEAVKNLQMMQSFLSSCVDSITWLSDLVTERQTELQVESTIDLLLKRIKENG